MSGGGEKNGLISPRLICETLSQVAETLSHIFRERLGREGHLNRAATPAIRNFFLMTSAPSSDEIPCGGPLVRSPPLVPLAGRLVRSPPLSTCYRPGAPGPAQCLKCGVKVGKWDESKRCPSCNAKQPTAAFR